VHRRHRWLPRTTLNQLLTLGLRGVEGCEEATITVGPSRYVGPGESNWCEFDCVVPDHSSSGYVMPSPAVSFLKFGSATTCSTAELSYT
jgi:hypothetical protein